MCRDAGSADADIFKLMSSVDWLCYLSTLEYEIKLSASLPREVEQVLRTTADHDDRRGPGPSMAQAAPLVIDFVHALIREG